MKPGFQNDLYREWSSDQVCDSPYCSIVTSGGRFVTKSLTLTAADANPKTENIFTITGHVRILEIYAICTEATDSDPFSDVSFKLYDGTNTVQLTAIADATGITVGSKLAKLGVAASALDVENASQIRLGESSFFTPYTESLVTPKNGATNYIQIGYTGDANTDIDLTFYCRYAPNSSGAKIEAV